MTPPLTKDQELELFYLRVAQGGLDAHIYRSMNNVPTPSQETLDRVVTIFRAGKAA